MAHHNIDARRNRVADELSRTPHLSHKTRLLIARDFACSHGAINADIIAITRPRSRKSAFPTSTTKAFVLRRDNNVCQYCNGLTKGSAIIVEHIIPVALGGIGQPYNLVAACQSCNSIKGRSVWIPSNLSAITKDQPDWCDRIHSLGTVPVFMSKGLLSLIDIVASKAGVSRNEFIVNTLQSVVG